MKAAPRCALIALLAACGGRSEPDPEPDTAGAEAIVRELFEAATARDCARVRPLVRALETEHDCEEYVEEFHADRVELLEIESTARDGRDRRAYIVHTRIRRGDREIRWLVRARWSPGGQWSLDL